jgi:hypothetical protein
MNVVTREGTKMKFSTVRFAAAALASGATMFVAGASEAQHQFHVTPGGGRCIAEPTISRDPYSGYYSASWTNICAFQIRVEFTYTNPNSGYPVNDGRWVPAGGNVSVMLVTQSRLDDWHEVFY